MARGWCSKDYDDDDDDDDVTETLFAEIRRLRVRPINTQKNLLSNDATK